MNDPLGLFGEENNKDPLGLFGDTPKEKMGFGTALKTQLAGVASNADLALSALAASAAGLFGDEEEAMRIAAEQEKRKEALLNWANPNQQEMGFGTRLASTVATLPVQILGAGLSPADTTQRALQAGETSADAVKAGLVDAAGNAVGIMLPGFKQGSALVRGVTGAGANVAQEYVTRELIQDMLKTEEAKKQFEMTGEDAAVSAIIGGGAATAIGRSRQKNNKPSSRVDNIRQEATPVEVPKAPTMEPEQLRLFDQFEERSPISPYQTEMAPDMWRVDENGIPIRADLSMEVQNLQNPLQMNLWGDEIDANFPRDPNKPLDMETGDIKGVERFSGPVSYRNDPENQIGLTQAIDMMPEGIRNRTPEGKFAEGTTRQSALDLLRREMPASPELEVARMDAELSQWLSSSEREAPGLAKERLRKTGFAKKQGGGVLADPFGRTPDRSENLQDLLAFVPYRFQTLESLPNKGKVTFEQIKQVLNREGVSAAEQHIVKQAFAAAAEEGSGQVTARALVDSLNNVIEPYKLSKERSGQYADYGLDSIGRDNAVMWQDIPRNEWTEAQYEDYLNYNIYPRRKVVNPDAGVDPVTNIWGNDQQMSADQRNHFESNEYVGHTRNFKEGGQRYVVEIQSDLLQKYKEPVSTSPAMAKRSTETLLGVLAELDTRQNRMLDEWESLNMNDPRNRVLADQVAKHNKIREKIKEELALRARQEREAPIKQLQKNWHVRLIREELADAARNGEKTVRFASADTMAKVEGWLDRRADVLAEIQRLSKHIEEYEQTLVELSNFTGHKALEPDIKRHIAITEGDIRRTKAAIQELEQNLPADRFDPQVQGIYDRYQKDVSKYLMSIGGKPVFDDKGNSWIEVPVEPHRRRPIMFGQRGVVLIDWSDETKKMENSLLSKDSLIPDNPVIEEVLSKARLEKDGRFWKYTQSGGTSAAMKTGSTLIKAASEIVQNAVKRADLKIRDTVFPTENALRKLPKVEMEELGTLLKDEMFQGYRYDGDVLAKHLTEKQLTAYVNLRDMFDATLAAQNEARVAKGQPPITAKEAYLSSRWQGDFRRPIKDADGKLVWYLAANSKMELEAQTKALLKQFPDLVVDKSLDRVVKSLRGGTDIQSMYSTMLDILGRDDPAIAKIKEAVEMQMAAEGESAFNQQKHFKSKNNVRGFVGDRPGKGGYKETLAMFQQQIQYAKNAFKWAELQKTADDMKALLSDEEVQSKQPNNVAYVREYFKNAVGLGESQLARAMEDTIRSMGVSPTVIDNGVGNMKNFFITQKLAVSAGYTAANLIQTSNVLPYMMNLRSQGFKGNPVTSALFGVPAGMVMAMSHYLKSVGGEYVSKMPNDFFKMALRYAEDNGVTARSIYDEAPVESGFGVGAKVKRVATMSMTIPETFIRSIAFMSYAKFLNDSGKFSDMSKLFQKAEELVNMSMVDYRETERPLMFSKAGTAGNFLNTLQTYPMSFYNQWNYMAREALSGRPGGLMTMLALQYAVAGAMGIPGFDDMDKLYKYIRDNLVSTGTWADMMESKFWSDPKLWMLENFGQASVYGVLSDETGVGMTSRVAAPGAGAMLQSPVGPITDIAKQAKNLGSAVLSVDDPTKWAQAAMSSAPVGLQGLLETAPFMEGYTYVTKPDGTKVFMKNSDLQDMKGSYARSEDEVAIRKWGLRSQREVLSRDVNYATQNTNQLSTQKAGELIDRYYNAIRKGDKQRANELAQLYTRLTGNAISNTQLENQVKEEMFTDIERNVSRSKTPIQLLNTGRALKLMEEK